MPAVRAYHFVGSTLRDGYPVPLDGEWLVHDGPLCICKCGLHASLQPLDALRYAPGFTLCLVDCDDIDDAQLHDDKFVCRRRRILARFDAKDLVLKFARDCAKSVLHLWDAPQVVRDFLDTGAADRAADAAHTALAAAHAAAADAHTARAAAYAAARAAHAPDRAPDAAHAAFAAAYAAAYADAHVAVRGTAHYAAHYAALKEACDAHFAELLGAD